MLLASSLTKSTVSDSPASIFFLFLYYPSFLFFFFVFFFFLYLFVFLTSGSILNVTKQLNTVIGKKTRDGKHGGCFHPLQGCLYLSRPQQRISLLIVSSLLFFCTLPSSPTPFFFCIFLSPILNIYLFVFDTCKYGLLHLKAR